MNTPKPFKILKGEALPKRGRPGRQTALSQTMKILKVGECFDYPFEGISVEGAKYACYMSAKRHGVKVSIPSAKTSPIRVWRVK